MRRTNWKLILVAVALVIPQLVFAQAEKSPAPNEVAGILVAIREYALRYTNDLPNFTCTQTTNRKMTPPEGSNRLLSPPAQTDLIEYQLSLVNHQESHKLISINRVDASKMKSEMNGVTSRGEFGNLLAAIFDPSSNTDFRWDRRATRDGHPNDVLAFRVPQEKGYALSEKKGTILIPWRGLVFADSETHAVVQIQVNFPEIPSTSEYRELDLAVDYKLATVAGRQFMLPAHSHLHARRVDGETVSETDYRSYRRFSSDVVVTFETGPKQ
jgi:hypothetical protein